MWDWIFGTLYIPEKEEDIELEYGLTDGESEEFKSVWDMYTLPFKKNIEAGRTFWVIALVSALAFFAITTWYTLIKGD